TAGSLGNDRAGRFGLIRRWLFDLSLPRRRTITGRPCADVDRRGGDRAGNLCRSRPTPRALIEIASTVGGAAVGISNGPTAALLLLGGPARTLSSGHCLSVTRAVSLGQFLMLCF